MEETTAATRNNRLELAKMIRSITPHLRKRFISKTRLLSQACVFSIYLGALFLPAQETQGPVQSLEPERLYRLSVTCNVPWTDTGYDVQQGWEIHFRASGGISLQVGNPMAYCGPDGYDLRTLQQPLQDNNIGALIGKVVLLISVEVDEETGEETRNEIVELFYIGSEQRVSMPIDGRLFLGINENVAEDNSGQFTVDVRLNQNRNEKDSEELWIRMLVFLLTICPATGCCNLPF